jgi:hypothetical protein
VPLPTLPISALILAMLASPPTDTRRDGAPAAAGPLNPKLETVDAGVADRGGLDTSFRMMPLDLRLPTGFSSVYRVPGRDDRLMRGNGALFAVFAQSAYRRTIRGAIPMTPAGVIYSIGMPGGHDFPGGSLRPDDAEPKPQPASRVDLRVKPRASTDAPREFRWNDGSREAASFDDGQGEPVNPAPAIAEAPRAKPAAQPAVTARAASRPVDDLQLGPARVSRE